MTTMAEQHQDLFEALKTIPEELLNYDNWLLLQELREQQKLN
jgi:hypothetical protein